jgi:hypothetical protein
MWFPAAPVLFLSGQLLRYAATDIAVDKHFIALVSRKRSKLAT